MCRQRGCWGFSVEEAIVGASWDWTDRLSEMERKVLGVERQARRGWMGGVRKERLMARFKLESLERWQSRDLGEN